MLKPTLIIAFVVITLSALAQPNCSGTWVLNKEKSTLNAEFSMAPQKIIVDQKGNDLKLKKEINFQGNTMNVESAYTLDGKECVNDGFQGSKIKSNVNVATDKKSYEIVTKYPMQDGNDMKVVEGYQMNGDALNVTIKASSSFGDMEEVWVFSKE